MSVTTISHIKENIMKITGNKLNSAVFNSIDKKLLDNGFKAGDEIYATAYSPNNSKEAKALKCLPTKGILSYTCYQDIAPDKYPDQIRYFIPYGKKGKLSYSKAVRVESRQYATTEAEAIEIYNDAVRVTAEMFEQLKNETLADII